MSYIEMSSDASGGSQEKPILAYFNGNGVDNYIFYQLNPLTTE